MRLAFTRFHAGAVMLALLFSLWALFGILPRLPGEYFPLVYEHIVVGLVCTTYSAVHLVRFMAKRLRFASCVAFYPLFVVLGSLASSISRSSAKEWATGTHSEVVSWYLPIYGLLSLALALSIWSCLLPPREAHGA